MTQKHMAARLLYALLACITVALGLLSRSKGLELPDPIRLYAGDTLWALMVYFLVRFIAPNVTTLCSALTALFFTFAVEFSQLYQAPRLNALRDTTLGALILGHGFLLSDLLCYSLGIGFGYLVEHALRLNAQQPESH